jgi:4-amino-4-deoxy-L-arabinose transferase-like glycosyltransferase
MKPLSLNNPSTPGARSRVSLTLAICVALLVLLALALRLYALDRWSLWLDETVQYDYATKPAGQLYRAMDAYAMPISLQLSHVLVQLGLGQNEWQLRLPAALLGVGTVILVYCLALELFCRRTAWLAGLVACVMPVLVVYSQEYRNYSLLIFLMVLGAWSLVLALRSNSPLWWTVFVGSTILNLYNHFVALTGVAALAVFALASLVLAAARREPVKPGLASTIMAFAIIGIAYVPALPRLAAFTFAEAKDMGGPGPSYSELFTLAYVAFPGFGGWLSLHALGLAILGVVWAGFRSTRALLLLVVMIVVPVLPFEGHNHVATSPRYISFVMPFLAIAIGAGLAAITFAVEALASRRWPQLKHVGIVATVATSILVLLASVMPLSKVYATNQKQLPVDLREGFEYVRARFQPNDLLLEASTVKAGSVYWFGAYNSYFLRQARWPQQPTKAFIDQGFPQQFKRYLDRKGRLWVLVTMTDRERASVEAREDSEFAVQCFRGICAIESRTPDRSILEQLSAFFAHYADLDAEFFKPSAKAVRDESAAEPR